MTENAAPARLPRKAVWLAGIFLFIFGARCAWIDYVPSALPLWDEWFELGHNWAAFNRSAQGEPIAQELVRTHNEHRLLTTRLVTWTLLLGAGYWDIEGEKVVSAAVWSLQGALLLVLLRPLVTGAGLIGLVSVVLGTLALPLSTLHLLSGFEPFGYAEIFSTLSLAVLMNRWPVDAERLSLAAVSLLLAFFSSAAGLVTAASAALALTLRAAAARRFDRPTGAVLTFLLGLCVFEFLLTPQHNPWAPSSLSEIVATLWRCLSFPLPGLALVSHAAMAVLAVRLVRGSDLDAPHWLLVALWVRSLLVVVASSLARRFAPSDHHYASLSAVLIFGYLAVLALTKAPGGRSRRWGVLQRTLPLALAALSVVGLVRHAAVYAWPTLREARRVTPALEQRFRRGVVEGDWREVVEATFSVERALDQAPTPVANRYTIPSLVLPLLQDAGFRRLLPPALTGRRPPALSARLLAWIARAWPVWLMAGLVMVLGAGARRAWPGRTRAEVD